MANESPIEKKIRQFKAEVGDRELTAEQAKIYAAFTKSKGSATFVNVIAKDGQRVRVKIYSNKKDNGVQHILLRHYKTDTGTVTALEILNFCKIIEDGERSKSNGYTVFTKTYVYGKSTFKAVVRFTNENGMAVLKSFYSDRNITKKSSRPACSSPKGTSPQSGRGAKSQRRCKDIQKPKINN